MRQDLQRDLAVAAASMFLPSACPSPVPNLIMAAAAAAASAASLAGKHAVVFGGTSGIGLAAVLKLAQRGASVVALSRNPEVRCFHDAGAAAVCPLYFLAPW
jgi:hypothetical protein